MFELLDSFAHGGSCRLRSFPDNAPDVFLVRLGSLFYRLKILFEPSQGPTVILEIPRHSRDGSFRIPDAPLQRRDGRICVAHGRSQLSKLLLDLSQLLTKCADVARLHAAV